MWRRLLRLEPLAAQFARRSPSRRDRSIFSPFLSPKNQADILNGCCCCIFFFNNTAVYLYTVTHLISKSTFCCDFFLLNGCLIDALCAIRGEWNAWRKGRVPLGMTNAHFLVILMEAAEEYRCTLMSHALVHRFVIHWPYRNCDHHLHSTSTTPSVLSDSALIWI